MQTYLKISVITLFFILGVVSLAFCAEDEGETFTITTYYPSPYGSYNELTTYSNAYLAIKSGNVGIGTSSPVAKLEVNGTVNVTGTVKMSGLQLGTSTASGNVLTADNTGNGTWQAAPKGLGTYVGATSLTYTGAGVGGYSGGNSKCAATFAGSRMCMAADFVNGTPGAQDGWYNTYTFQTQAAYASGGDCLNWTQNMYSGFSLVGPCWMYFGVSFPQYSGGMCGCSTSHRVLCCK